MSTSKHLAWALTIVLGFTAAAADRSACRDLPDHAALKAALSAVVTAGQNGGLAFNMWATVVNRDGEVCAVVFTGADRHSQWPGSRVISAQKANAANAFSLPGFALSTANLFSAVQPGGSLYGLQHSNPVDTDAAYGGNSVHYGQPNDSLVGEKAGGINVFGGGLGLYTPATPARLVGGIGVSGDTSCTDHIVAWKVRKALNLDNVPAGVAPGLAGTTNDNLIHDIAPDAHNHPVSAGGFGHPTCLNLPGNGNEATIIPNLPTTHPVGPTP